MQEYEGTFLNIDKAAIEKKLNALGATCVGETLYRSTTFDFPGFPLDADAAWVRLRDEGDKITLAYKQRLGVQSETGDDAGMREHEVTVSDFAETAQILLNAGFIEKFSMEQKRTRWTLDDITFDIDVRPMLDPYLEIESTSDERVLAGAEILGLDAEEMKVLSATQIYELAGIRDKDYIKMTFDECVKRDE